MYLCYRTYVNNNASKATEKSLHFVGGCIIILYCAYLLLSTRDNVFVSLGVSNKGVLKALLSRSIYFEGVLLRHHHRFRFRKEEKNS